MVQTVSLARDSSLHTGLDLRVWGLGFGFQGFARSKVELFGSVC